MHELWRQVVVSSQQEADRVRVTSGAAGVKNCVTCIGVSTYDVTFPLPSTNHITSLSFHVNAAKSKRNATQYIQ